MPSGPSAPWNASIDVSRPDLRQRGGRKRLADPDREIEAALDQVDKAVIEPELDHDLRARALELGKMRGDVGGRERARGIDTYRAARRGVDLARLPLGIVELGEQRAHHS
jgi:hypothetical protein